MGFKKLMTAVALGTASMAGSTAARADLITFDSSGNPTGQVIGNRFIDGDFEIFDLLHAAPAFNDAVFMQAGDDTTFSSLNEYAPASNYGNAVLVFQRTDGQDFYLDTFDFGPFVANDSPNQSASYTLTFNFSTDPSEVVNGSFDNLVGKESYSVGKTISSIWIAPASGESIKVDNFLVNNQTIAAVPEASTWAMMLIGFGAVGASVRRKRRTELALLPA